MTNPIGWCDVTWSPITGCDPVSPGCDHCWARRMARRLAGRYGYPEAPNQFDVTLRPDRLEQPLRWKKPRRVFVCSMADLFHPDVPFKYISRVFNVMSDCGDQGKQHVFMVLTKRPERIRPFLAQWLPYQVSGHLPNVWLGVTAENQEQADKRIPLLLQVPAAVRFVSVEPMLSSINIERYLMSCNGCGNQGSAAYITRWEDSLCRACGKEEEGPSLDWTICGSETGPGARPMELEWARDLRDQCKESGTPYFFKKATGGDVPDDLMIREFPR